jgi:hypothetical protein
MRSQTVMEKGKKGGNSGPALGAWNRLDFLVLFRSSCVVYKCGGSQGPVGIREAITNG